MQALEQAKHKPVPETIGSCLFAAVRDRLSLGNPTEIPIDSKNSSF
jgi:hypothetical protein